MRAGRHSLQCLGWRRQHHTRPSRPQGTTRVLLLPSISKQSATASDSSCRRYILVGRRSVLASQYQATEILLAGCVRARFVQMLCKLCCEHCRQRCAPLKAGAIASSGAHPHDGDLLVQLLAVTRPAPHAKEVAALIRGALWQPSLRKSFFSKNIISHFSWQDQ